MENVVGREVVEVGSVVFQSVAGNSDSSAGRHAGLLLPHAVRKTVSIRYCLKSMLLNRVRSTKDS